MAPGYKLLIELDALFDTRLGALLKCSSDDGRHVLLEDRWHTRYYDDLTKMGLPEENNEIWKNTYNNRDKTVLRLSPPTLIYKFIRKTIKDYILSLDKSHIDKTPSLVVNTYPYRLNEEETEGMKRLIEVNALCGDITIIYHDPTEFTVKEFVEQYSGMLLYNYNVWLDALGNDPDIYSIPLIEKVLIFPQIYHTPPPPEYGEEDFGKIIEETFSYIISPILLPAGWFSSISKFEKKT